MATIKEHLDRFAKEIDFQKDPLPWLIFTLNWSRKELYTTSRILKEFEEMLDAGKEIDWEKFEDEFLEHFGFNPPTIKPLVKAFNRAGLYQKVCRTYAKERQRKEFEKLIGEPLAENSA